MPVSWPIDLANTSAFEHSLTPATRTSSADGTGVDCLTFEGPIFALLTVGVIDTASGNETYAFKIQESADNSSFTDITGATFTAVTASSAKQIINIDNRQKRYVRAVATLGGTTPSAVCGVAILAKKKIAGSSGVKTSN